MTQLTEINNKKKSFAITTVLFCILFLLLLLLKYNSQNISSNLEGGGGGGEIAVNFGDSEVGSGDNFESMELEKALSKTAPATNVTEEEILTNASDENIPTVNVSKKTVEEPKMPIEKPIEKPKPSQTTTDALSNLLNGASTKSGDGNDNQSGNKGKLNGNPNEKGYAAGGGSGSGGGNGSGQGIGTGSGYGAGSGAGAGNGVGNWQLSGRKLASRSKQVQKCNEYGTVVVQITVNRNGNVIAAKYAKGTTNTSQCLLDPAYETAKSYKWQQDLDAPETQIGYITVNFKQSE
jgi:outer membrane biosynthesis protein TonB